jgi:hypothetical protein
MNVKQNLSILFFPKNQKLNKQGESAIYVRITIYGLKDEFSSRIKSPRRLGCCNKNRFSLRPKGQRDKQKNRSDKGRPGAAF